MSIRSTVFHCEGVHVYHDLACDDNDIYIEIENVQFETTNNSITIRLQPEIFEVVRQVRGYPFQYLDMTDSDIAMKSVYEIDNRLKYKKSGLISMLLIGAFFYPNSDLPRSQQILELIETYKAKREMDRSIKAKVAAMKGGGGK